MPLDDFLLWSAPFASELSAVAFSAPAILVMILAIHCQYFNFHRGTGGQQEIALHDLTSLESSGTGPVRDLTVVHGEFKRFDAETRTVEDAVLALPSYIVPPSRQAPQRLHRAQSFADVEIKHVLICADDVEVRGRTTFFHALKVSGDLLVDGHAIFRGPVIINGVLKVQGCAHFAAGVISKGDAMILGSLSIGSDTEQGWAVLRELALGSQLNLNGTVVASRAVELRRAA